MNHPTMIAAVRPTLEMKRISDIAVSRDLAPQYNDDNTSMPRDLNNNPADFTTVRNIIECQYTYRSFVTFLQTVPLWSRYVAR